MTKLQLTDKLEVSLDGSYTIGDLAFQRGSDLVISSATGRLMLYYEGMALSCGDKIVMTRHETGDQKENGLRFNNNLNLFSGDLHIRIKNGMLQAVLHIPVEEYLLGVVPYEMSDSFPLEALKAQAVAARTYALKKIKADGDYDVVDNTNDQVYYGFNAANTEAVKAVKETEGICAYYNGQMAICYYTASNGGQVELIENVWGKDENGGYITMHDDPYDLENHESVVKRTEIAKKTQNGTVYNAQLTDYLLMQISEQIEGKGYGTENGDVRIDSIEGISLHSPSGGYQSKVMTQMRFDLNVSVRKNASAAASETEEVNLFAVPNEAVIPSPTPAVKGELLPLGEVVSADVPVFSCIEPWLELSINGSNNEVLTVTEAENTYCIESRRYGHGVGMSQRGAQWMAGNHGWTYEQILRFYYPGITLKKVDTSASLQPAVSADYLATPGPAATATPRPTLMPVSQELKAGEWKVKVTQIAVNSSLNMRKEPNTSSEILRVLYYGQELIASERLNDGWIRVRTDVLDGYVMEKFVEAVEN
ncbi:MAG: SpoIID/LytB domain-containing protein [Clostridia bacterium]|nr:SpoIID/LytB domain-containing protein [Clostridia bacterium]